MYSRFHRAALAVFIIVSLTLAGSARAQTQTGSVIFEVTDTSSGVPLPGVSVTVRSAKLQGTQVRETDNQGRARFLSLPPGAYKAEFHLEGYIQITTDVALALGDSRVEYVGLSKGELTETTTVIAARPIEPTETSTRDTFTKKTLQKIQLGSAGRSYQNVLQRSPGVGGGGNPSVHGGTAGENVYLIDGVNTTDPVTGTFGLNTNFDVIDEIEFVTGGFQAEYGQATGGIANQITISGGNEWHGSFDARYSDQRFDETGAHYPVLNPVPGTHPRKQPRDFHRYDLTLDGFVKKDKLWCAFAYSDIQSESVPSGARASRVFDGSFHFAKFTWLITPKNRLAFQYTADPADISNDNASSTVAPAAGNFQEQGAKFYTLTYWGQVGEHWSITAQAGRYRSVLNSTPLKDSGLPSIVNDANGYRWQNYNDAQFSNRDRDQFGWTAEYVSGDKRWHDVKFGIDRQDGSFDFRRDQPGGEEWHVYEPGVNESSLPPYEIDRLISAGKNTDTGEQTAIFAQDTFHVTDKVTLDYGLRWDRSKFERDDKQTIMDLKLLQPRFGAAFDLAGDAKDVIRVSLARYMHPNILTIPNAVNAHGDATLVLYDETQVGIDCNGDGDTDDGAGDPIPCFQFGGPSGSQVIKGTEATHVDEITLGYKHLLRKDMVFGTTVVYRSTDDIIEDTEDPANPGLYIIKNIPELSRQYRGLELTYGWNSRRWHVNANYTLSAAKGNIEYTQGLGTDWDFVPALAVNRYGYLSYDRKHALKVFGWVDLPKKWSVAYDLIWRSGLPQNYTRIASRLPTNHQPGEPDDIVAYGDVFREPRGSRRRPAISEMSVEGKKTFDIGKTHLQLIGTCANAFNSQTITAYNVRTLAPSAYQQPRRWEIGLRFEF